MGFLTSTQLAATATAPSTNSLSLSIPANVDDGDLVFTMFASNTNPANAWSTPSGWTLLVAQKSGGSSFGGRGAIFYKTWRNGDSLTVTSTLGANSTLAGAVIVVKSDTDGASVQIGNPPSGGFTSGYDSEMTTTTTTATIPQLQVDETSYDLRLVFLIHGTSAATYTPAVPAQASTNLFRAAATVGVTQPSNTPSTAVFFQFASDPSGSDAGTTSWTQTNGKSYVVGVVLGESGASSGIQRGEDTGPSTADVPLNAVGLEEIVTLTQSGGGASINVF